VCEQLARGSYLTAERPAVKHVTYLVTTPPCHSVQIDILFSSFFLFKDINSHEYELRITLVVKFLYGSVPEEVCGLITVWTWIHIMDSSSSSSYFRLLCSCLTQVATHQLTCGQCVVVANTLHSRNLYYLQVVGKTRK